jgi:hypothetical protein
MQHMCLHSTQEIQPPQPSRFSYFSSSLILLRFALFYFVSLQIFAVFSSIQNNWKNPHFRFEANSYHSHFCQFVPISVKCIRSMYGVNICYRNGAKARVFHREKSAKRGFMKSSRHSSTESIQTMPVLGS